MADTSFAGLFGTSDFSEFRPVTPTTFPAPGPATGTKTFGVVTPGDSDLADGKTASSRDRFREFLQTIENVARIKYGQVTPAPMPAERVVPTTGEPTVRPRTTGSAALEKLKEINPGVLLLGGLLLIGIFKDAR